MSFKEIAKKNDLKNGEMKSFKIDDKEVLLCRIKDEFFAVGAYCTHYGAPLEEGILKGDTIICPWHHSWFNAKSGKLMEPPAMDSLPKYEIKTEGDSETIDLTGKIESHMVKKDIKSDKRTFVILGAGASSFSAAKSMRENGFRGNIIMITEEDKKPYDRPNLSKDYLAGNAKPEWMPLRPDEFYDDYGIELKLKMTIKNVDFKKKVIGLGNGENLKYDKLLIATGGIPRRLEVPGAELKNIFYLRSFKDADEIINAVNNSKKAVIVGASFIAMETAHSLTERKINVTVVAPDAVPFERIFGKEIGYLFQKEHEKTGTTFKLKSGVKKFIGDDRVKAVLLESGEEIETDFVVIGIGVKPSTQFISGIKLLDDGSIKTDAYLQVEEDVYASGDIATFPDYRSDNHMRIEHWRLAEQHGRMAGANMTGKKIKYEGVPFFWTAQAGMTLGYVGHIKKWDDIIIDGDISQKKFITYYIKDNKILAAAGINRDKELAAVHILMKENKLPDTEKLRTKSFNILSLI